MGGTRLGVSIERGGPYVRRARNLLLGMALVYLLVTQVSELGIVNSVVLGAVLALVVGVVIRRQQREEAARDTVAEILHPSDDDG